MEALPQRMSRDRGVKASPFNAVTLPPASVMRSAPAAMSQTFRPCSHCGACGADMRLQIMFAHDVGIAPAALRAQHDRMLHMPDAPMADGNKVLHKRPRAAVVIRVDKRDVDAGGRFPAEGDDRHFEMPQHPEEVVVPGVRGDDEAVQPHFDRAPDEVDKAVGASREAAVDQFIALFSAHILDRVRVDGEEGVLDVGDGEPDCTGAFPGDVSCGDVGDIVEFGDCVQDSFSCVRVDVGVVIEAAGYGGDGDIEMFCDVPYCSDSVSSFFEIGTGNGFGK